MCDEEALSLALLRKHAPLIPLQSALPCADSLPHTAEAPRDPKFNSDLSPVSVSRTQTRTLDIKRPSIQVGLSVNLIRKSLFRQR